MDDVSIVIPAKDEIEGLSELVPELKGLGALEIIVVDDGSSDGTSQLCNDLGAKVVSHPYSKGNGAAVKTGARHAEGDILLFMDADGQHQSRDVVRLIDALRCGGDMVVGARDSSGQASFFRRLANNFYNALASYMTGASVKDLTSGFRAVDRRKFCEFLYLLPNKFSYPTTITMAFFRAGYSVIYMPVDVLSRKGKSHLKPLKDGARFLIIIFKVGTLYSPLKLFLPISFGVFLLGLCYYGYTYFMYHAFTNMSALMFTTSLITFLVGLVSEQITALMYKS